MSLFENGFGGSAGEPPTAAVTTDTPVNEPGPGAAPLVTFPPSMSAMLPCPPKRSSLRETQRSGSSTTRISTVGHRGSGPPTFRRCYDPGHVRREEIGRLDRNSRVLRGLS